MIKLFHKKEKGILMKFLKDVAVGLGLVVVGVVVFTLTVTLLPKLAANLVDPRDFITPNDPIVQATLSEILANRPFWRSDIGAIRAWVDLNVIPTRDDRGDHWQKPAETIIRGQGDCEDFAILMVTLLRAYGIPPEDIYVALGVDKEGEYFHAFVVRREWGEWRVMEPQEGGLLVDLLVDFLTARRFDTTSGFNDVAYWGKPMWASQFWLFQFRRWLLGY